MRLIDADVLIKDLSYLYTRNHIPIDMKAKEVLTTIMEQPTAYDVDKVVEKLEEIQDKAVSVKNEDISIYATGMMGKTIEIVKAGEK